ncbi:hypothetical protein C446_10150 [Halobiforma nitratireducens JCM 10879]|uniref:Uncharacterized protein n=1 Tax=Halobiforma nitratireducens JCM 10879 TaxID=1227454 RepID=M0LYF1_9EURY|nr:hypothetical protein C446_10150 [Halobiforma nitratireducens JCM 10879]
MGGAMSDKRPRARVSTGQKPETETKSHVRHSRAGTDGRDTAVRRRVGRDANGGR